ncbi:hypothetical protein EV580_1777 [Mycobacterium sp. BK086]|uniref:hypothetical protein n=1 Tax=Mycobacterium sp. BK086 TaxID=2512165 RepID=UPI00105B8EF1|nr:hypothetical protein [Mycobacterium sp. BK086]TDO18590.1 hypothetical protein EV580_1777 [Mycobacterium sp. BK086]
MRFELVPATPTSAGWMQRKPTPPLVLDIGDGGAITLSDSDTNELVASAAVAQVTATPAKYQYMRLESLNGTQPLVILDIPELQPISIGARSLGSAWGDDMYRYRWRDRVPNEKRVTHELADADWLSLVTQFGLSALVHDDIASGRVERRTRINKAKVFLEVMLVLFVIALAAYLHFAK